VKALRNISLTLALATVLLAALSLTSDRAAAYSRIRVATSSTAGAVGSDAVWDLGTPRSNVAKRRIKYVVGTAGTPDRASFTGGANADTEFQALQQSFAKWRDIADCDLDFEFAGAVTAPTANGNDDVNTVFWTSTGVTAGTFAETTTTFDTTNGKILDADLVFNDRDFAWDVLPASPTAGTAGRSYIEQIATHELGHFCGLDHSFNAIATMFPYTDPGAINFLSLEQDDISATRFKHPDPDSPATTLATVAGKVTSAGTGRLGVLVTLIDVATRKTIVSALTDRTTTAAQVGDFTVRDVPPGNYWVLATRIFTADIGSYYSSSFTSFLPTARGQTSGTITAPTILAVKAGDALTGIDFAVSSLASPLEPNNDSAHASAITLGQAFGGRIDTTGDADYFQFSATQGDTVKLQVHADALGQELNPEMTLYSSDGTTRLVTGEFGQPTFNQSARDIDSSSTGPNGVDFDCKIDYAVTLTGTYYLRVRGTSNSTGDYWLSTYSNLSSLAIDPNVSKVTATVAGVKAGGASFPVTVEPKNIYGVAIPSAVPLTVSLIDRANSDAVLQSVTAAGPWVFTVAAPVAAGTLSLGAKVAGVTLNARLDIPVSAAVSPANCSLNIVATSLVADGLDTSPVEVRVRDAADRLVVDPTLTVNLTASTGTLTAGANSGVTVNAVYDLATGIYRATLKAPSSGTTLNISATVASQAIAGESIDLTEAPSGTGTVIVPGTKSSGGGGCALAIDAGGRGGYAALAVLSMALLAHISLRRRRDS
jgi:hypothetical protein